MRVWILASILVLVSGPVFGETITRAQAKEAWAKADKLLDSAASEDDYRKVLEVIQPLADAGLAEAQNTLGWMYDRGRGLSYDPRLAIAWYTKAALAGEPFSATRLGDIYSRGRLGQPVDMAAARKWYEVGEKKGLPHAGVSLAFQEVKGEGGPVDRAQALQTIYGVSDPSRDKEAQSCLAFLYATEGEGVPRNPTLALMWCRLCGDGIEWISTLQSDLEATLSRDEIARATASADECRRVVQAGGVVAPSETLADGRIDYDPDPAWREIPMPRMAHLLVPVKIAGQGPFNFILDTGFSYSCIDGKLAKKLGLKQGGLLKTYGQARPVYLADGTIFRHSLAQAAFVDLSLDEVNRHSPTRIDGFIGYNLLNHFVVEINYRKSAIRLSDPARYSYAGAGTSVPLQFRVGHPYLSGTFQTLSGQSIPAQILVDTGSDDEVFFTARSRQQLDFPTLVPKVFPCKEASMVDGLYERVAGRFQAFSCGGVSVPFPIASCYSKWEFSNTGFAIGGGLLSRFNVVFDYSRSRLILEPTEWLSVPKTDPYMEQGL